MIHAIDEIQEYNIHNVSDVKYIFIFGEQKYFCIESEPNEKKIEYKFKDTGFSIIAEYLKIPIVFYFKFPLY